MSLRLNTEEKVRGRELKAGTRVSKIMVEERDKGWLAELEKKGLHQEARSCSAGVTLYVHVPTGTEVFTVSAGLVGSEVFTQLLPT